MRRLARDMACLVLGFLLAAMMSMAGTQEWPYDSDWATGTTSVNLTTYLDTASPSNSNNFLHLFTGEDWSIGYLDPVLLTNTSQSGGTCTVVGGAMRTNSGTTTLGACQFIPDRTGDFTSIVEWSITNAGGVTTQHAVGFHAAAVDANNYGFLVRRAPTHLIAANVCAPTCGTEQTFSTTATSGRFKIQRAGSTWTLSYDVTGGACCTWTVLWTGSGPTGNITYTDFRSSAADSTAAIMDWDNFRIAYSSSAFTTPDRVLEGKLTITGINWWSEEPSGTELDSTTGGAKTIEVRAVANAAVDCTGIGSATWREVTNGQNPSATWSEFVNATCVTLRATARSDATTSAPLKLQAIRFTYADPVVCPSGYTQKQLSTDNTDHVNSLASGYLIRMDRTLVNVTPVLANQDDLRIYRFANHTATELDRIAEGRYVWFKTQAAIPALTHNKDYWICWGNSAAGTPPADLGNLFQFSDNFNDNDLATPASTWNTYGANTPTNTGGKVNVAITSDAYPLTTLPTPTGYASGTTKGYWALDSSAADSSSCAATITWTGSPVYATTQTNMGSGIDLESTSSQRGTFPYAACNDLTSNLVDWTVDAWVKVESATGAAQTILAQKDGTGTGRSIFLLNEVAGILYPSSSFPSGTNLDATGSVSITAWHHVGVAFHAAGTNCTYDFYIDGSLDSTKTRAICADENATGNYVVGAHKLEASQFFDGIIDDLHWQSGARGAAYFAERYRRGLPGVLQRVASTADATKRLRAVVNLGTGSGAVAELAFQWGTGNQAGVQNKAAARLALRSGSATIQFSATPSDGGAVTTADLNAIETVAASTEYEISLAIIDATIFASVVNLSNGVTIWAQRTSVATSRTYTALNTATLYTTLSAYSRNAASTVTFDDLGQTTTRMPQPMVNPFTRCGMRGGFWAREPGTNTFWTVANQRELRKTTDNCQTSTLVYTFTDAKETGFPSHQGIMFAQNGAAMLVGLNYGSGVSSSLYRSTDRFATAPTVVLGPSTTPASPNGAVYSGWAMHRSAVTNASCTSTTAYHMVAATYGNPAAFKIFVSSDDGATWADKSPTGTVQHFHSTFWNPFNGWLYEADHAPRLQSSTDCGTTWTLATSAFTPLGLDFSSTTGRLYNGYDNVSGNKIAYSDVATPTVFTIAADQGLLSNYDLPNYFLRYRTTQSDFWASHRLADADGQVEHLLRGLITGSGPAVIENAYDFSRSIGNTRDNLSPFWLSEADNEGCFYVHTTGVYSTFALRTCVAQRSYVGMRPLNSLGVEWMRRSTP